MNKNIHIKSNNLKKMGICHSKKKPKEIKGKKKYHKKNSYHSINMEKNFKWNV